MTELKDKNNHRFEIKNNFGAMKKAIIMMCLLITGHITFCQVYFWRTKISGGEIKDTIVTVHDTSLTRQIALSTVFVDTLQIKDYDYQITHYHIASREIERKILTDPSENIFNDSLNQHSRLILSIRNGPSFNIPTIPLTHLIFLKNSGLIIGLSKIASSPYHIVIYSSNGKLIEKRSLNMLELELDKSDVSNLIKIYPKLSDYFAQTIVVKENEKYYIEISREILHTIGREKLIRMNKLVSSKYFPAMNSSGCLYCTYSNFFLDSDPFSDLIMIGSTPNILVLNSEDGRKVNIRLVSLPTDFLDNTK